jgi:hypothetical protein
MKKEMKQAILIVALVLVVGFTYISESSDLGLGPGSEGGYMVDSFTAESGEGGGILTSDVHECTVRSNKRCSKTKRDCTVDEDCPTKEKCSIDQDSCIVAGIKGKTCSYDQNGNPLCCDWINGECKCEKPNVNPCGEGPNSENKCLACMAYAEAGGNERKDNCMKLVQCTIKNRINKPEFGKPISRSVCDVVSKLNQYEPYNCVCDSKNPNQKYCKCCAEIDGVNDKKDDELTQEEKDMKDSYKYAENLDCRDFSPDSFNNAGMDSWAKRNCKKVENDLTKGCTKDTGEPVFDFYKCA